MTADLCIDRAWFAEGYGRISGYGPDDLRTILLDGNLRSVRGRIPWRILEILRAGPAYPYDPPGRAFLPESYRIRVEHAAIAYRRMLTAFRPGMDRIVRLYAKYETLLHLNPFKKHYRDHKLHQLAVTILADRSVTDCSTMAHFPRVVDKAEVIRVGADSWAEEIARRLNAGGLSPTIREFHGDRGLFPLGSPTFEANDVRYALGSAALLHDIGYLLQLPLDQYGDVAEDVFPFLDAPLPVVVARVRAFLKGSLTARWIEDRLRAHFGRARNVEFETDVLPWVVEAVRRGNHGAASCAFLLDHLSEWRTHGDIDDRTWFCLQWAALAILRHDLIDLHIRAGDRSASGPNPEESPKLWGTAFEDDPISFLLIFADNLHESFRHRLTEGPPPSSGMACCIEAEEPCKAVEIRRKGDGLEVEFVFLRRFRAQADRAVQVCRRVFNNKRVIATAEGWTGWAPYTGFVKRMKFSPRLV